LGKTRLVYLLLFGLHHLEGRKIIALTANAFSHEVSVLFGSGVLSDRRPYRPGNGGGNLNGDFQEGIQSDHRDPIDAQDLDFDWRQLYERLGEDVASDQVWHLNEIQDDHLDASPNHAISRLVSVTEQGTASGVAGGCDNSDGSSD
jgi:hypothetical protein